MADGARCGRCGGEVGEDGVDMVCYSCGHSVEQASVARTAAPSERGWMVSNTGVDETNYKAHAVLKEMAKRLQLEDAGARADQAHRVMREYELRCRVRRAAWAARRRLGAAALALAATSLDALCAAGACAEDPGGRERAAPGRCSDDDIDDDAALAELAARVRARLEEEWQPKLDASDWAPPRRAADGLGRGSARASAPHSDSAGDEAAGRRRHPSEVPGGFAALRMTVQQIRDDMLQTSDDYPVCAQACRAIQERLWKEPTIQLEGQDGLRQPVSWPIFDQCCADANLSAERHRVFALLQHLAAHESICRRGAPKQGFSWKSQDFILEAVAAAALFSVCRRANYALRLEEVGCTRAHAHALSHLCVCASVYFCVSASVCLYVSRSRHGCGHVSTARRGAPFSVNATH